MFDTETTVRACQLGITFARRPCNFRTQKHDSKTAYRVAAESGTGKRNSKYRSCWIMTNSQILYCTLVQYFTAMWTGTNQLDIG